MAVKKELVAHPNESDFAKFIAENKTKLVIVDFFAEWCMPCVMLSPVIDELAARLELSKSEVDAWLNISRHLKILYDEETKLFEQFDGYFALKDYVIEKHDREGQTMLPDGIADHNIQSTRLIKQADVISMMMLFPHAFSFEQKQANFDFYEKRTAHQSSLSHCIHAMVGIASSRRSMAYNYFMKTALFDLENLHGNTALGIHAAAVGGTWQTVIHGFAGFSIKSERLVLKPWLPIEWQSLSFSVRWKTRIVEVTIYQEYASVLIRSDEQISLPLSLYGKTYKLMTNRRYDLPEQRKKRRD